MFLAARTHALLKHDHPCRTSRPVRPYHPAAQSPGFAADPRKSQSRRDYEFAMPPEEDLAAPADASFDWTWTCANTMHGGHCLLRFKIIKIIIIIKVQYG